MRRARSGSKRSATISRTGFLLAALDTRARELPALTLIEDDAEAVEIEDSRVTVRLAAGATVSARLADRRGRAAARSAVQQPASRPRGRSYPQTALTCNLGHSRPHRRHLDRIPHRDRPVHAWCRCPAHAPAWCSWSTPPRPPRSPALVRCRDGGRDRAALPFDPGQGRGRAGPRRVSARGRDRARVSPPAASR